MCVSTEFRLMCPSNMAVMVWLWYTCFFFLKIKWFSPRKNQHLRSYWGWSLKVFWWKTDFWPIVMWKKENVKTLVWKQSMYAPHMCNIYRYFPLEHLNTGGKPLCIHTYAKYVRLYVWKWDISPIVHIHGYNCVRKPTHHEFYSYMYTYTICATLLCSSLQVNKEETLHLWDLLLPAF